MGEERYVWVVRHKGDYKKGKVRVEDILDVRWDRISGGVKKNDGMWGLYGYIYCNKIVEGEIGHSGIHGSCPHYIKVRIQKCDNDKSIYEELATRAGVKSEDRFWTNRIADKIREIVEEKPGITAVEVADILENEVSRAHVQRSIRYLKKNDFKTKSNIRAEKCGRTYKLYIATNE